MSSVASPGDTLVRIPRERPRDYLRLLISTKCKVAVTDEHVWILAESQDPAGGEVVKRLPGPIFQLADQQRLLRRGNKVAEATLPQLSWHSVWEMLELELPTAAMAASKGSLLVSSLKLCRRPGNADAVAGIYGLSELEDWIATASDLRFRELRYVIGKPGEQVSTKSGEAIQQALVMGHPLPSIAGQLLWRVGQTLLPLGFHWLPTAHSSVVEAVFDLPQKHLLLWLSDHAWSYIPEEHFRPLCRASIRSASNDRIRN